MSTRDNKNHVDLLQGTLDLLILRTLGLGPVQGHGIATIIERGSGDVRQVEQGSVSGTAPPPSAALDCGRRRKV
jgi:PadR family transcriptional regulator